MCRNSRPVLVTLLFSVCVIVILGIYKIKPALLYSKLANPHFPSVPFSTFFPTECHNITANVGTNVILPCTCSSTSSLISWQIGETIVYAQNRSLIASQYQGRTEIQENSCSLILSQVRTSDEGEYTCYHKAETFSDVHTTLQVTGK
ncbi:hypothetical protein NFI96_018036 [Prochilodus magdalenae]|nr:hypothetical protein NFI96_018036 [Prochilodus magdalenae]